MKLEQIDQFLESLTPEEFDYLKQKIERPWSIEGQANEGCCFESILAYQELI